MGAELLIRSRRISLLNRSISGFIFQKKLAFDLIPQSRLAKLWVRDFCLLWLFSRNNWVVLQIMDLWISNEAVASTKSSPYRNRNFTGSERKIFYWCAFILLDLRNLFYRRNRQRCLLVYLQIGGGGHCLFLVTKNISCSIFTYQKDLVYATASGLKKKLSKTSSSWVIIHRL